MKRDPLVEIEVGILGDTTASLGQAGRKLERALAALATSPTPERARRLLVAAEALWAYAVQREAVGLHEDRALTEAYDVPRDVWRLVGARPSP